MRRHLFNRGTRGQRLLSPLTWQTYDIDFTAARYKDGKKVANARTTIKHNGITIHDDQELPHGTPGKLPEEECPGLLYLQGHGNPVVYRKHLVRQEVVRTFTYDGQKCVVCENALLLNPWSKTRL